MYMSVCKLFLLGKCYNPYCPNEHFEKKEDNTYSINGSDYITFKEPDNFDIKYARIKSEKNLSEFEKFRN